MGQILGFWHYSSNELGYTEQEMYGPVKHFPHKSFNFVTQENTSFGHISRNTSSNILSVNLPVSLPEEGILFTAQGLLNNKAAIIQQLQLKADQPYADGWLMLRAYLKWGKQFIHRLNGDWSVAIFDYREHELFLARDPLGYTSLYYYSSENSFYFSSSIKSILNLKNYHKQLNELHFVKNLTLWDDNQTLQETYYKNIYSLPPAHTLSIKNKNLTLQKYWPAKEYPVRKYKQAQQYVDEMQELFTCAVKSRVNNSSSVASMLSGGLDSSAVSYVAANLLKEQKKNLITFSHVPLFEKEISVMPENKNRILNELPLIMQVVEAAGNMQPVLLNSQHYSILKGMTDAIDILDAPSHASCNLYWMLDIFRTTQKLGFSTLLTGEGGNGSISFAGIDYLLPFSFSRLRQHPYLFLRNQVIKPIAKKHFSNFLKNRKDRARNTLTNYVSSVFATKHILEDYDILNDIDQNEKDFNPPVWDIRKQKERFTNSYFPRSNFGAASGHYFGFNLMDPTTDIDLMNYFFSIPNEVFFDEHYNNRMLVKKMMKGKIPNRVLLEKRKGLQSADIVYRVKTQASEISAAIENIKNSTAASYYIDIQNLSNTWQLYLHQTYVEPYQMQNLLKALQFALFLQTNFD